MYVLYVEDLKYSRVKLMMKLENVSNVVNQQLISFCGVSKYADFYVKNTLEFMLQI